ncbi:TRAPP trafficking subunit Trs65-domain-containing protein [Mycena sp. CBHHK59/15]|nr:TRAPP trafficking subunit Trs65-domain-containing protein [Mycena sp. CBHHK59/15]
MATLGQLFASATLDVVVPDTSLEYPPATSTDDWLSRLNIGTLERTQAFFDEQLQALLVVRVDHPPAASSIDPAHPPKELLSFLSHLQISLEATYISSVPAGLGSPETPRTARLSAPPRTASLAKLSTRSAHPPIFPPNTPNPTPSSAETDKRYLKAEGTLLLASIWGQNSSADSQEAFSLLWSTEEEVWVAVYRLSLTVSFLRLAVNDPLLCLTVSATLRDRPQTLSRPNHPLALFLTSVDYLPASTAPISPTTPTATNGTPPSPTAAVPAAEPTISGLPEINLLEGLSAGPSFPPSTLGLPTARLGSVSRLKLFTLQPLAARTPLPATSPSPMTAIGRPQHPTLAGGPATLRKSFRKTLRTVSGFRVRMRTVFVPSVLLPTSSGQASADEDADEEWDRLEAGTDERTVVLCVEVENSGESGRGVGFEVERVDVKIGGVDDAGARAVLVGWGVANGKGGNSVFPMRVGAMEQYNLLYAVSFLRSPDEALAMGLVKDTGVQEMLQRAVTISIFGKPYLSSSSSPPSTPDSSSSPSSPTTLSYPTKTFSSKWNCVLDLSAQPHSVPDDDLEADGANIPNALPEPASPFPTNPRPRSDSLVTVLRDSSPPTIMTPPTAGTTKRHTLPGGQAIVAARALGIKSAGTGVGYRASTSMLNPSNSANKEREVPPLPGFPRSSSYGPGNQYTPPSVTAQAQMPRSPTTYAAPQPAPPRLTLEGDFSGQGQGQGQPPMPMTPAYPSYPTRSAIPPTPPAVMAHTHAQGVGGGAAGKSVEIRRERGLVMDAGVGSGPQTPGPIVTVGGGTIREEDKYQSDGDNSGVRSGEAIVVSVGLVASGARKRWSAGHQRGDELGKIYPLDHFTLDIFVFNQSEWTRRFEVTCPDRRRGRGRNPGERMVSPGIVPLDNRVRIGPLLPAACQSVRMEFLAVTPGVHSINTLTLTDVVSGYSMNLRSVMDIVVHEPGDI